MAEEAEAAEAEAAEAEAAVQQGQKEVHLKTAGQAEEPPLGYVRWRKAVDRALNDGQQQLSRLLEQLSAAGAARPEAWPSLL